MKGLPTAYVINHAREGVEVFNIDTSQSPPALKWAGCILAPAKMDLNAAAPLPGDGIVATVLSERGDPDVDRKILAGQPTGFLLEWLPKSGWRRIPGSEASANNGVEVSKDGKYIYVAAWSGREVIRLNREAGTEDKVTLPVGFYVDNLRFADDGSIIATGQAASVEKIYDCWAPGAPIVCAVDTAVIRIDPKTMRAMPLFVHKGSETFGAGTTAIEFADEYWVGTFRGSSIARVAKTRSAK